MRGHFGCGCTYIYKATAEYTTGFWWAFYMRMTATWPLCDLGGGKKTQATGHHAHGTVIVMATCTCRVYARLMHYAYEYKNAPYTAQTKLLAYLGCARWLGCSVQCSAAGWGWALGCM